MAEKKLVFAACAVITNPEGQIFLTQRNHPDVPEVHEKWQFPGGKIEYGEHPEETVKREVKEETGFDVEIVKMLPRLISTVYDYGAHAILVMYVCRVISGEFKPDDRETKDGRFFNKEEIDYETCLPNTKEIIELLY